MPLSETEEFEFRARAEKEAAVRSAPTGSLVDQIPGGRREPEREQPSSLLDKAVGLGETAGSTISSLASVPIATGQSLVNLGRRALGDTSKMRTFQEEMEHRTIQPTTPEGQRQTTAFGQMLESTKLPPWPVTSGIPGVGAAARAVESGAVKAGKAIAASPEADLIRSGFSKAKGALTPTVDPDRAALARKAQALGIDLRPDMLTDNKFARIVGQALEDVPLSGSKLEARQEAFNRALIGLIGGDTSAAKLAPDVFSAAMDKSGSTIGELYGKTPVPLDAQLQSDLNRHLSNTSKETSDVAKVVQSYVEELRNSAENGVIPGTALRKINTEIGARVRGADSGDLRRALADLQDDMRAALGRQLSGNELEILRDASKKYAIGIKLIPLVAKSQFGDISPSGLMQAITNDRSSKRAMAFGRGGDAGDLARIGQVFLKEPKSSGTAERGLVYGGILTDALKLGKAAALYPVANVYNRAGPAISRALTGFKPESKPFGRMVESTQPESVSFPKVPGAAPIIPGIDPATLLQPESSPNVPLPQLPPALLSGLEKQLGVPGSSISLGESQGRTPLPAIPPQESGVLSTFGAPLSQPEAAAMNAVEMKLRPEVIEKIKELRSVYSDPSKTPLERQQAARDVGSIKDTYPGFVADLENADATFKMLYETGKGTALPIEKSGKAGPTTTAPKAPPTPPAPDRPIMPRMFPQVPGVSPVLPGSDFGSMLRSTAEPSTPLPQVPQVGQRAPEIIASLKALLGEDKPAMTASESSPVGKFEAPSLLQVIRKKGGIDKQEIRDITGEDRVGAGRKGLPPNTFKTEGKSLGSLAQELADEGWAIDTTDVDGGVQQLRELIRDELDGNKVYSIEDTDRQAMFEYNERMREQGEVRLTAEEQDQMLQLADREPPISLDVWQELTEDEKDAELDKLFGADTNPKSKGEKGR